MAHIDTILARPLNCACDQYGSSMGRYNQSQGTPETLHLQRMRIVDGYDTGGAYWGSWSAKAGHMYCAHSPENTANEFPIRVFVRAFTREEAKSAVLATLPGEGWKFLR